MIRLQAKNKERNQIPSGCPYSEKEKKSETIDIPARGKIGEASSYNNSMQKWICDISQDIIMVTESTP